MMNGLTARLTRIAIYLVVVFFVLVSGTNTALALESSNVKIRFSSEFIVDAQNHADVTIGIRFRNKGEIPTVLTTYDLNIGEVNPKNVSARHDSTLLKTSVRESRGTAIRIDLGEELVQVDESYYVEVKYEVDQFLTLIGGAYDVELPMFEPSDSSSMDSVTLTFDESFAPLNYCSAPYKKSQSNGSRTLTFDDLDERKRLYVSLGDEKFYSVLMERILTNESQVYSKQTFKIPPEFGSQVFILDLVSPFPDGVTRTVDGDYVFSYDIAPGEEKRVRVQGVLIERVRRSSGYFLSPDLRTYYTDTSDPLLTISDEDILADLEETDGMTVEEIAGWLYDYVREELSLSDGFRELHGIENRKGADVALRTYKDASVEDYSDSFVALSRTLGVPARVVAGYIYPYSVGGSSLGMFHVWPQYWTDEYGWVSLDPAYEEYTSLEQKEWVGLNRIVMSMSYDSTEWSMFSETTDEIVLTNQTTETEVQVSVSVEMDTEVEAGNASSGTLMVENAGNIIAYGISVSPLEDSQVQVTLDDESERTVVLPGETVEVPFTIEALDWYVTGNRDLSFIVVAETSEGTERMEVRNTVQVKPLWWVEPLSWGITILVFGLFMGVLWLVFRLFGWVGRSLRRPPDKMDGMLG